MLRDKHSKKSSYVGTGGGGYTDMDGLSRQFTYIDHDKKVKVAMTSATSFNFEWERLQEVTTHPLYFQYLKDNELEEYQINLGHLREIKELIDKLTQ